MNPSRTRASRVFTISFPEELAKQVVAVADEESRNLSELFREAFRAYDERQVGKFIDEMGEYARTRNLQGYTEADIPRLIDEVRAEMRTEREVVKK